MDLHRWLDQEPGRSARLADFLGCSKAAVSLWREKGVPMDRMRHASDFTDGQVTVDDMLRHAYEVRQRLSTVGNDQAPGNQPSETQHAT